MSKKLRSLLSFIASTCIGLLILAYMTRNITTVISTGLIVYTILFTYLIFELINSEKENKKLQEQIKVLLWRKITLKEISIYLIHYFYL